MSILLLGSVSLDFVRTGLQTRTAVARSPCHQPGFSCFSSVTCSNHRNPVFFLISLFLTLSFHVILKSLRWNL